MVQCWARALGGCSSVQSGEHLFSAALFRGKMVTVQGFHWCPEPKTVGIASLTANILCTIHNSELSPLDSAALQTLDTLGEAHRLVGVRVGLEPRPFWHSKKYRVKGPSFEAWFMKTTVNLFHVVGSEASWLLTGQLADDPPMDCLEIAFGRRRAEAPMGLYSAEAVGLEVAPRGHFRFYPIFATGNRLAGAGFQFEGFQFLLWAYSMPPPDFSSVGGPNPLFHVRRLRFTIDGASSHAVDFSW